MMHGERGIGIAGVPQEVCSNSAASVCAENRRRGVS